MREEGQEEGESGICLKTLRLGTPYQSGEEYRLGQIMVSGVFFMLYIQADKGPLY